MSRRQLCFANVSRFFPTSYSSDLLETFPHGVSMSHNVPNRLCALGIFSLPSEIGLYESAKEKRKKKTNIFHYSKRRVVPQPKDIANAINNLLLLTKVLLKILIRLFSLHGAWQVYLVVTCVPINLFKNIYF